MNSPVDPQCFLNLNWDGSIDPALSSIGEISSFPSLYTSNLPTNVNIPMTQALIPTSCFDQVCNDPGFVERATRFPSFDGQNYNGFCDNIGLMGLPGSGACLNLIDKGQIRPQPTVSDNGFGSTVSDPSASVGTSKKRKCAPKGKGKDNPKEGDEGKVATTKRCKGTDQSHLADNTVKPKVECAETTNEDSDKKSDKKDDAKSKAAEPPKDYIHVRARRGQATDSHSLAERVRREKISQRMKLLQDLVPGCNKVTGKAVMLDEIINYVQSLQRQVEFLSMKLATVNPQLDFNTLPNLLSKDGQSSSCNPMFDSVFPLETSGAAFSFMNRSFGTSNTGAHMSKNHHSLNGINDIVQQANFWETDLQTVASSQSFHAGQMQELHMKNEL
ncbi:hypothetical protein LUZ61_017704 [Rhynchospora tenuis]|uniref:BHLH domain-containing protein n=1 Tax=Rhynchospora tenuis TaxID=198213 RepID=A0AAD5Z7X3_9POAL|nr:hypothetical protein LUZ61_017704 [Rhynchospora tenuis]